MRFFLSVSSFYIRLVKIVATQKSERSDQQQRKKNVKSGEKKILKKEMELRVCIRLKFAWLKR